MDKISQNQKDWNFRRSTKLNSRRLRHKEKLNYFNIFDKWPSERGQDRGHVNTIRLPANLSLKTHYNEVMECVEKIREYGVRRKRPLFVDFRKVRSVGPCGALLLAAELDRWRTVCQFRHRIRAKNWHPDVLRLMNEMGLFEVLGVLNPPKIPVPTKKDLTFYRFRSGSKTKGINADQLANIIEKDAGPVPERAKMYRGLSEAMANVVDHAYPRKHVFDIATLKDKWWMAGSFDQSNRKLTLMVFDQGVGIPYTLPREHTMEKISGLLDKFGLRDDDSSRIKIAMELGKTQTGHGHRGKGLFRDIRPYTEIIPDGILRVLSGRGEYIYTPHNTDPANKEKMFTHSQSIGGTLILWEGTLPN